MVHLSIKMSEKILTQHFDVTITLLSSDKIKKRKSDIMLHIQVKVTKQAREQKFHQVRVFL